MVAQQVAAGLLVASQTGAATLAWHKSPRSGPVRGRANTLALDLPDMRELSPCGGWG